MKVYNESESFPVTNELFFPSGGCGGSHSSGRVKVCAWRRTCHLVTWRRAWPGLLERSSERVGGTRWLRRVVGGGSRAGPPGGAAGWAQLFEGSLCSPPGRWEGVLFKHYHLIFIFGCGWAC